MQDMPTFVSDFYQLLPPMSFIVTLCSFIYEKGICFLAHGSPVTKNWGVLIIDYSKFLLFGNVIFDLLWLDEYIFRMKLIAAVASWAIEIYIRR